MEEVQSHLGGDTAEFILGSLVLKVLEANSPSAHTTHRKGESLKLSIGVGTWGKRDSDLIT